MKEAEGDTSASRTLMARKRIAGTLMGSMITVDFERSAFPEKSVESMNYTTKSVQKHLESMNYREFREKLPRGVGRHNVSGGAMSILENRTELMRLAG